MAKTIIDAAKAQEPLTKNDHNRRLSPVRIRKFADEMQNGMWVYNGESIIVSESGRLLDGQHRLHAIVDSGAEIELIDRRRSRPRQWCRYIPYYKY